MSSDAGRAALAALMVVAAASAARAQCPDGTPPPCRSATAGVAPAALPLDTNAVAVLPFTVEGPGASVAWLGTGMVDVLSGALDGVRGWRAIPPRTVLARIPRAGLDLPRAAQAARGLGAGQMVSGSAVVVGRTVRLRAELYSTVTRQRIGLPVETRGNVDDPAAAMDSLAVGLSRLRLGARAGGRAAEFGLSSPQALRAWIAAEELTRRARIQEGADSLQAVIARDSGFAPAYYRLYIANTYGATIAPWTGVSALRTALRHADRLTTRQRDILNAALAGLEGDRFRALELGPQVGARYADDADAAYVEGEAYFHFGLDLGEPVQRALQAFERGIALDSTLIDNYNHTVELRYRLGRLEDARALIRQGLALQPDHIILHAITIVDRVASGESAALVLAQVRRERSDPEPIIIRSLIQTLRCLDDDPARALEVRMAIARAMQGNESPRATRGVGMMAEAATLFGLGRRREAMDAFDAAAALGASGTATTGVFGFETAAEFALVRSGGATWPSRPVFADSATLPRIAEGVAAARDGTSRLAAGDSTGARTAFTRAFAVRSAPNTAGSLAFATLGLSSLLLARLDLAAGSPRVAWQHAQEDLLPSNVLSLRAEFEELRGTIAERLGDREAAIRGYRNFVALWAQADPELQPRVQAAREALARLGAP